MAAGMGPLWASLLGYGDFFFLGIIFAVLIYARHWANITRLRAGTETKIGAKT